MQISLKSDRESLQAKIIKPWFDFCFRFNYLRWNLDRNYVGQGFIKRCYWTIRFINAISIDVFNIIADTIPFSS